MYLVFPMFTAKPISLQAFNNTSAFLSIVLISSPINRTEYTERKSKMLIGILTEKRVKEYMRDEWKILKNESV